MSKRAVRILFSSLAFFICLEFAILCITKMEPYPAVIFPGFGTIPASKGTIVNTVFELEAYFADGYQENLPPKLIFNGIPTDFHPYLLKKIYEKAKSKEGQEIGPFKNGLKSRLQTVNKKNISKVTVRKLQVFTDKSVSGKDSAMVEDELTILNYGLSAK